jgi:hypothetical protein
MFELPRRRFLQGLIGLIAAPAIVKVTSLMPVKAAPLIIPANIEVPGLDVGVQVIWGDDTGHHISMMLDRHGMRSDEELAELNARNATLRALRDERIRGGGLILPLQA